MTVNRQFLDEVFSKQPGKYIAVSAKFPDGDWKDQFFKTVEGAANWLESQPRGSSLYFCPTKLLKPRRVKENVAPSRFLYSDLDEADPKSFAESLKPTHAWESSPHRFQALWELDEAAKPSDIETRNRGIAVEVGGDRSGWDLTQVLRVPGTKNYKYKPAPRVKLLWSGGEARPIDDFPQSIVTSQKSDEVLVRESSLELRKILRKYRRRIPRKALSLLTASEAQMGKRSDVLWYLSHSLVEAGIPEEVVFSLIRASVWNKYRGRRDEIERLSHEIRDSQSEAEEEGDEEEKSYRQQLVIVSHADLMANPSASPGWLVDKFWTRESHGIIAGEPKSFKSTLLMDFVVSIASGEPFLGQFDVTESGPVLVIQNENSDWIMQDRLHKIVNKKGIAGKAQSVNGSLAFTAPAPLPIYYINQQSFTFSDESHLDAVEDFVSKARPVAVIFDPLYLMFDGDMNSAKDLGPALSWLLYLKQEYMTSVMLVHHWNKGGGHQKRRSGQRMLGSTTLHGWVESAWYISVSDSEESDHADMDRQASSVSLVLEREFRGAGIYPKVDVTIAMGDFGSRKYEVGVDVHSSGRKKEREPIEKSILDFFEMTDRVVSLRALSAEIGQSRKITTESVNRLVEEGKLQKVGKGFKRIG